ADDLSVQVHPDDAYARPRGDSGKTEAWYVLDAAPEAKIVYGHRAPDRATLQRWVKEGAWDTLLVEVPVKPGDFFFVPSGTLHAIGRGLLILEIQQSSDTTYRVYDYDRVDAEGKKRELHLEDALAVTRCPSPSPAQYGRSRSAKNGAVIDHLVACDVFRIDRWMIDGTAVLPDSQTFFLVSVLEGSGEIQQFGNRWTLSRGDHVLMPAPLGGAVIDGRLTALISMPVISTHRK
ncbi:MAG: mannose-6-phosphate isomerase, class I, partial [Alicyclobacillaceae bacterium]|nr:mannose-6-phosphate isomerase, class I [Alicyclobacillaceae bacterium]